MTTTTINTFWGPDNMDSSVWTFKPRHCRVPGVSFPQKAGYINWDLLNHDENAGRKVSVSQEDINKFADQLRRKGILTDKEPFYYDIDTLDRIDGELRYRTSVVLDILGWMGQPVKFANARAKRKFSTIINNTDTDINRDNSIQDIEVLVLDLMVMDVRDNIFIDDIWIRNEVETSCMGSGSITGKQREGLIHKLISKVQSSTGKFASAKRYTHFKKSIETHHLIHWASKKDSDADFEYDSWYDTYVGEENTLCLEEFTWNSTVYKIMNKLKSCNTQGIPMNFLLCVNVPSNPKADFDLDEKRKEIFEKLLPKLEESLLSMNPFFPLEKFPWNHPLAEHRFIAQDTTNEGIWDLIKIPNRNFN
jgi:hypothetical protein